MWHGNRTRERWTFRRVLWPSMEEADDFWQVTGGSASLSAFSDLKDSGSIDYKGTAVPDDNDCVRVYYGFTDAAGERWEGPVLTGFLDMGESEHDDVRVSGSADIRGMLAAASDTGPGYPLTVAAGIDPVAAARGYAEALGLKVSAAPCSYRLGGAHTFEQGDTWLAIINWLLTSADFSSAYTDPWGTVQMQPYVEPVERTPLWTFRDDETSFFKPGVKSSDNRADTINVVRLWFENDQVGLFAEARNDDPLNRSSTVTRGRELLLTETVDELAGDTPATMLQNLEELAAKRLRDNSTRIEYKDIPCLYAPFAVNDCAQLDYTAAGLSTVGSITQVDVDFGRGADTTVRVRTLLRPDFKVTTSGRVAWSA